MIGILQLQRAAQAFDCVSGCASSHTGRCLLCEDLKTRWRSFWAWAGWKGRAQ